MLIGDDGRVKHISGVAAHKYYDQSVVDALSQWTFKPATIDGTPIGRVWEQSFVFRLK